MTTLKDIISKFSTGDLILFHGFGIESEIIEFIDDSPYSHVAMVMKFPELSDQPLLWSSDEITNLNDYLNNGLHAGVHLMDLQKVLDLTASRTNKKGEHYTYSWRKLEYPKGGDFMQTLEAFMRSVDGRAFPTLENMAINYADGKLGKRADQKTFFCSQLATNTYIHVGIFPDSLIDNSVAPGDYGDSKSAKLPFQNGAKLTSEVPFTHTV
ncbi:hypothetical protein MNBD_GAMMA01-2000 [hydrothermal vent metagenome]|uniref:Uncharacterized protein n=1 Tax=hydrothermal vent metagenome TaxID=652676 RepID=A0A3B0VZR2_9ZZZZ